MLAAGPATPQAGRDNGRLRVTTCCLITPLGPQPTHVYGPTHPRRRPTHPPPPPTTHQPTPCFAHTLTLCPVLQVGAALELFESLELWDSLIVCYRLLDKKVQVESTGRGREQEGGGGGGGAAEARCVGCASLAGCLCGTAACLPLGSLNKPTSASVNGLSSLITLPPHPLCEYPPTTTPAMSTPPLP